MKISTVFLVDGDPMPKLAWQEPQDDLPTFNFFFTDWGVGGWMPILVQKPASCLAIAISMRACRMVSLSLIVRQLKTKHLESGGSWSIRQIHCLEQQSSVFTRKTQFLHDRKSKPACHDFFMN